jgi:NTP pyrophosphatase (non-canonical NTP hydrolase)|tara:strand:+ start:1827 stop:2144 length:318 start_codon:yes stop_codon:yes gene_type:complete
MNMNDYQRKAHTTAVYPKEKAFEYLATGLAGEAGEVASIVAKWIRRDRAAIPNMKMVQELGDVLWFVSEMSLMLGTNLSMVAEHNIKKLQDRQERNMIKGDGDDR